MAGNQDQGAGKRFRRGSRDRWEGNGLRGVTQTALSEITDLQWFAACARFQPPSRSPACSIGLWLNNPVNGPGAAFIAFSQELTE